MLPIEPDNFKNDGTDLEPEVIDRIIEMAWDCLLYTSDAADD